MAIQEKFQELRKAYPGSRLLIVSNTAGTRDDTGYKQADVLERNTGVKVLRHDTKVRRIDLPVLPLTYMRYHRNRDAETKYSNTSKKRKMSTLPHHLRLPL